jgi:hypothetical protein
MRRPLLAILVCLASLEVRASPFYSNPRELAPSMNRAKEAEPNRAWQLRLRGGMIFTPDELVEMYDAEEHQHPDSDYNITEDVVEEWSKEKQEAFEKMCDDELERHWKRLRSLLLQHPSPTFLCCACLSPALFGCAY